MTTSDSLLARSVQLGALVGGIALMQGVFVYGRYGLRYRKQPHPTTPASGRERALVNDYESEDELVQDITPIFLGLSPPRGVKRILVVGDSLAVGVGCSGHKPIFPAALARILSATSWRGCEVEWASIGQVGGSTREVHQVLQKHLSTSRTPIDLAVVIVGLNDIKGCALPWKWDRVLSQLPNSFHSELCSLIMSILAAHPDAQICVPALPATFSPITNLVPLCFLTNPLFDRWERQKRAIAEAMPHIVTFVPPPEQGALRARVISVDDIHPSDAGYRVWASHIASSLRLPIKSSKQSKLPPDTPPFSLSPSRFRSNVAQSSWPQKFTQHHSPRHSPAANPTVQIHTQTMMPSGRGSRARKCLSLATAVAQPTPALSLTFMPSSRTSM